MSRMVGILQSGQIVLSECPDGVKAFVVRSVAQYEVNDESQWRQLHSRMKTGKLNHATVKKILALSGDN